MQCAEEVPPHSMSDLCRICAAPSSFMINVFGETGVEEKLVDKIQQHLHITVSLSDRLPQQVCHGCVTWLRWTHELFTCAARADRTLRQMLGEEETTEQQEAAEESSEMQQMDTESQEQNIRRTRSASAKAKAGRHVDLQCWQCSVVSSSVPAFLQHQASVHQSLVHGCVPCKVFFSSKSQLQAHESVLHTYNAPSKKETKPSPSKRKRREAECKEVDSEEDIDDFNNEQVESNNETSDKESCVEVKPSVSSTQEYQQIVMEGRKHTVATIEKGPGYDIIVNPLYKKVYKYKHKNYSLPTMCKICNKDLKSYHKLQKHRQEEHEAKIKCKFCEESFQGMPALKVHENETHKNIKCHYCEEHFTTDRLKERHMRKEHKEYTPYICEVCGKTLRQDQKYSHMLIHINDNCLCDICGKSFKFKGYLRRHMSVHSNRKPKPTYVKCTVCSKNVLKRRLEFHMNYHNGVRPYQCLVCRKQFFAKNSLIAHKRIHSSDTVDCEICSITLRNKKSYNNHLRKHYDPETKNYHCAVCYEAYPSIDLIVEHCQYHSREDLLKAQLYRNKRRKTNYQCDFCSKYLENKNKMKNHVMNHLNIGTKENKFKCELCNKSYSTFPYLANHMMVHEEESKERDSRFYKCQYCERLFENLYSKNVHEAHHLDSKSIVCQICSQEYFTVKDLTNHLKLEHFSDGCVTYNEYTNFVDYGAQYKCNICNKLFSKLRYLKKHLEIHGGEKRFACDICGRRFLMKSDMQKHRLIHTGGYLFYCDKCEFGSNRLRDVRQHDSEVHLAAMQPAY